MQPLVGSAKDALEAYQSAPFYAIICANRWVVYQATALEPQAVEAICRIENRNEGCRHHHVVVALHPQPKTEALLWITRAATSDYSGSWEDWPMIVKAVQECAAAAYDTANDMFVDLATVLPNSTRDQDLAALRDLLTEAQVIVERHS